MTDLPADNPRGPTSSAHAPRASRAWKRVLPRTLFARSLLIMATPLVLAQIIATYIFFNRHWDAVTWRLSDAVGGEIAWVMQQIDAAPDAVARDAVFRGAAERLQLVFTLDGGARLGVSNPAPYDSAMAEQLWRALSARLQRPVVVRSIVESRTVEARIETPSGVLRVLVPDRRLFTATGYVFIVWMVGSAVVLFMIALVFMRNQIRPIRRLARAAELFGKGRDVKRFKPEGAYEVRQAAQAFLQMRERIRRQIDQRTEMLAGVSHDLRTPLTRMRLQLAMLDEDADVRGLKQDVDDMQRMIEAYLDFARGQANETSAAFDAGQLARDVASGYGPEASRIATAIAGGDLSLTGRPVAIKRALTNLVDNALRYAGRVEVSVLREGETILFAIEDDGPGIPPAHREAVFKPFFRLESSRNPSTGGTGLGLAIARDIARSHGGDIALDESRLGGLRAVLRLPV
jgi:two-component system osmolarity sensor histidine kinase EnvZ